MNDIFDSKISIAHISSQTNDQKGDKKMHLTISLLNRESDPNT